MTGRRLRSDRPATVLTLLVAFGLVALLTLTAPDTDQPLRDWTDLGVGEQGRLRDFALTVDSAEATDSVELRDSALTSTGVFVVVRVVADVLVDPVDFDRVVLRTRTGNRYDPRGEWIAAQPSLTQPGFTVEGIWVFEIPRDARLGAQLLAENDSREFDGYDTGLRIDLGLGADASTPGPVRLADTTSWVTR